MAGSVIHLERVSGGGQGRCRNEADKAEAGQLRRVPKSMVASRPSGHPGRRWADGSRSLFMDMHGVQLPG